MNETYIQFAIAMIAGIAAVLTGLNIIMTNKNINIQKEQWEFSLSPVFKISYIATTGPGGTPFVLENTNSVYHEIEDVSFTMNDVRVSKYFDGTIEKGAAREAKDMVAKGLIIVLKPKTKNYSVGYLQIKGKDSLGNNFKVNSQAIEFKNFSVVNDLKLSRTYLKKI